MMNLNYSYMEIQKEYARNIILKTSSFASHQKERLSTYIPFTNEHINELHNEFRKCTRSNDDTVGVSLPTFRTLLKPVLEKIFPDKPQKIDMEHLFLACRTTSRSLVTWEEFFEYLLEQRTKYFKCVEFTGDKNEALEWMALQRKENDYFSRSPLTKESFIANNPSLRHELHRIPMNRIRFHPSKQMPFYYSASWDGMLKRWRPSTKPGTHNICEQTLMELSHPIQDFCVEPQPFYEPRYYVAIALSADGFLTVSDAETGQRFFSLLEIPPISEKNPGTTRFKSDFIASRVVQGNNEVSRISSSPTTRIQRNIQPQKSISSQFATTNWSERHNSIPTEKAGSSQHLRNMASKTKSSPLDLFVFPTENDMTSEIFQGSGELNQGKSAASSLSSYSHRLSSKNLPALTTSQRNHKQNSLKVDLVSDSIPSTIALNTFSLKHAGILYVGFHGGTVNLYEIDLPVSPNKLSQTDSNILKPLQSIPYYHYNSIHRLLVIPQRKFLISASGDTTIQVRSTSRLEHPLILLGSPSNGSCFSSSKYRSIGHSHGVEAIDYSESQNLIASAALEPTVFLWSTSQNRPVGELLIPNISSSVVDVCFGKLQDANLVITLDASDVIRLWDIRMLRCIKELIEEDVKNFSGKRSSYLHCIQYDSLRERVLIGNTLIRSWESEEVTPLNNSTYYGHRYPVCGMNYIPWAQRLCTMDSTMVCIWSASNAIESNTPNSEDSSEKQPIVSQKKRKVSSLSNATSGELKNDKGAYVARTPTTQSRIPGLVAISSENAGTETLLNNDSAKLLIKSEIHVNNTAVDAESNLFTDKVNQSDSDISQKNYAGTQRPYGLIMQWPLPEPGISLNLHADGFRLLVTTSIYSILIYNGISGFLLYRYVPIWKTIPRNITPIPLSISTTIISNSEDPSFIMLTFSDSTFSLFNESKDVHVSCEDKVSPNLQWKSSKNLSNKIFNANQISLRCRSIQGPISSKFLEAQPLSCQGLPNHFPSAITRDGEKLFFGLRGVIGYKYRNDPSSHLFNFSCLTSQSDAQHGLYLTQTVLLPGYCVQEVFMPFKEYLIFRDHILFGKVSYRNFINRIRKPSVSVSESSKKTEKPPYSPMWLSSEVDDNMPGSINNATNPISLRKSSKPVKTNSLDSLSFCSFPYSPMKLWRRYSSVEPMHHQGEALSLESNTLCDPSLPHISENNSSSKDILLYENDEIFFRLIEQQLNARGWITCIVIMEDLPYLITGSSDGILQFWYSDKEEEIIRLKCTISTDISITVLRLVSDKQLLLVGDMAGYITVLDIRLLYIFPAYMFQIYLSDEFTSSVSPESIYGNRSYLCNPHTTNATSILDTGKSYNRNKLSYPFLYLVARWRGHEDSITSIEYQKSASPRLGISQENQADSNLSFLSLASSTDTEESSFMEKKDHSSTVVIQFFSSGCDTHVRHWRISIQVVSLALFNDATNDSYDSLLKSVLPPLQSKAIHSLSDSISPWKLLALSRNCPFDDIMHLVSTHLASPPFSSCVVANHTYLCDCPIPNHSISLLTDASGAPSNLFKNMAGGVTTDSNMNHENHHNIASSVQSFPEGILLPPNRKKLVPISNFPTNDPIEKPNVFTEVGEERNFQSHFVHVEIQWVYDLGTMELGFQHSRALMEEHSLYNMLRKSFLQEMSKLCHDEMKFTSLEVTFFLALELHGILDELLPISLEIFLSSCGVSSKLTSPQRTSPSLMSPSFKSFSVDRPMLLETTQLKGKRSDNEMHDDDYKFLRLSTFNKMSPAHGSNSGSIAFCDIQLFLASLANEYVKPVDLSFKAKNLILNNSNLSIDNCQNSSLLYFLRWNKEMRVGLRSIKPMYRCDIQYLFHDMMYEEESLLLLVKHLMQEMETAQSMDSYEKNSVSTWGIMEHPS